MDLAFPVQSPQLLHGGLLEVAGGVQLAQQIVDRFELCVGKLGPLPFSLVAVSLSPYTDKPGTLDCYEVFDCSFVGTVDRPYLQILESCHARDSDVERCQVVPRRL